MEINVDFLLAGCNTRCRHCYVHGGPGPMMPLPDALLCLERLDALAALLPPGVSFTLDNEPMNHPRLAEILEAASRTRHIRHDHHGMTTGLALMGRDDRKALVAAYLRHGCRSFGVTLHGAAAHHDELVRRPGAHAAALRAARFLKGAGARLEVSLMMNRFFPEDADDISRALEALEPDDVYVAVPIFTPHPDMPGFEPYRAALGDLEAISGALARWGQDAAALLEEAGRNTVRAARERLRGTGLRALWEPEQTELYLSLHADCALYVGNTGAETALLGDLRRLDLHEAAARIRALPGNRDYGAFYDPAALPDTEAVLAALDALPQTLVYGDFASAIYRALTALRVPTKLLK